MTGRTLAALLLALLLSGTTAKARTLTDQTGHTLTLAGPVTRVGTPGISMASLILALSEPQKLVAITPEVRDNPWLQRIVPAVRQAGTPFTRPAGVNLEALLALQPQLVTLWTGNPHLARRLAPLGIAVLNLEYHDPDSLKAAVRLLGDAMGPAEQKKATAFVQYYDSVLQRVSQGLAGLPGQQRPRVYYAGATPLDTEGRHSMVDAWIRLAGGLNVAAEAGLQADARIQPEQLLLWDPDLIITLDRHQQQAIQADPRWQSLRAVREQRVLANPGGINAWCTRAAESALQLLWAARLFHPERFAGLDLAGETRYFYQTFYHYLLDEAELARVLHGEPPPGTSASR